MLRRDKVFNQKVENKKIGTLARQVDLQFVTLDTTKTRL
jgi:hypothetical protein